MRVWGMTTESHVQLSSEDRAELEGWVAGRNTPQKLVWRGRSVLMWADGAGITKMFRRLARPNARPIAGAITMLNVGSKVCGAMQADLAARSLWVQRRSSAWLI